MSSCSIKFNRDALTAPDRIDAHPADLGVDLW
jgi:hypothetical protein